MVFKMRLQRYAPTHAGLGASRVIAAARHADVEGAPPPLAGVKAQPPIVQEARWATQLRVLWGRYGPPILAGYNAGGNHRRIAQGPGSSRRSERRSRFVLPPAAFGRDRIHSPTASKPAKQPDRLAGRTIEPQCGRGRGRCQPLSQDEPCRGYAPGRRAGRSPCLKEVHHAHLKSRRPA
jgi:hypothetical protein